MEATTPVIDPSLTHHSHLKNLYSLVRFRPLAEKIFRDYNSGLFRFDIFRS